MGFLDVSRSTLNRYRMQDKLPYSKVGQKIYYRLEDIQEMLRRNYSGEDNRTSKSRRDEHIE